MNLTLKILGIPKPKQSAKFRAVRSGNKTFVTSYQKKEVKDMERNIAFDVKSQLPEGFVPYDEPIGVRVNFVFPPISSLRKWERQLIQNGGKLYKDKKPDLTDNLMKGLFDALEGIVFTNDSRVCKVESEKYYGPIPCTEIEFYKLNV